MATANIVEPPLASEAELVPEAGLVPEGEQQPCSVVGGECVAFSEEYHGKNAKISAGGQMARRRKT